MEPKLGVALTKCYFCNGDNEVLINTLLTPYMANQVEKRHQKVINMNPCPECEKAMRSHILLIGIDNEKSDPDWHIPPNPRLNIDGVSRADTPPFLPNPYRVGKTIWVSLGFITQLVGGEANQKLIDQANRCRFMFVEEPVIDHVLEVARDNNAQNIEEYLEKEASSGETSG